MSSDYIAVSVNTNPVIIRRILGALAKAKLVSNQAGKGGGSSLLKIPKDIHLLEIYQAVIPRSGNIFAPHPSPPHPRCPVGSRIQNALKNHLSDAQVAMEKSLAKTTLAEVLRSLRQN